MHFPSIQTTGVAWLILTSTVSAVPIPQSAGFGAGCDAILSDADTGSGLAIKEAGQNAASLLKSAGVKRQGAGFGAACNSILSDADTGSGLAVKEAGQNAASLLKAAGLKARQLDKVGAGTAAVIDDLNPTIGAEQESITNAIDGYGTSESAQLGQQVGDLEVEIGTGAGNLVPSNLSGGSSGSAPSAGPPPPPANPAGPA